MADTLGRPAASLLPPTPLGAPNVAPHSSLGAPNVAPLPPPRTTSLPEQPIRDWSPTVIVLGPGGIKGFLELGALLLLEKEGYLQTVRKYSGVSVGAILSLLLVAGYTVAEIINDALEVDLMQDFSSLSINNAQANAGLTSNRPVKERLTLRVREKFGMIPTLSQLYMATGIFWEAVSLNLDKNRAEYHNKDTDPTLSCIDAALMSANIPLFFYRLEYKKCVHIDGAFANPYPVDRHDDGNEDVLGIYITTDRPETHVPVASSFLLYLYRIIDASMTQIRKRIHASSSSKCKHLELFTDVIDTTGFTVSTESKVRLITDGYRSAKNFLQDMGHHTEVLVYDGTEPIEQVSDDDGTTELVEDDALEDDAGDMTTTAGLFSNNVNTETILPTEL